MLQTVIDTCKFKQDAIDFAMTDQIEDLADLADASAANARLFFDKTYLTEGMRTLLRQGLQRLNGQSGQAVFELRQAMGGGKTHSMLSLGYMAAQPDVGVANKPRLLWFNRANSKELPPDESFVFDLEDHFAGTLVTVAFNLDAAFLRQQVETNDGGDRSGGADDGEGA